jgi:hypothetical protein
LSSDYRSPKARYRFSFSGPLAKQQRDRVTADDILESLTRQAELRQKLGESYPVRLEEIAETEEMSRFQGLNLEPASAPAMARNWSFGHLAFVFMLLIGLIVVWLYSSVSKGFDLTSLNSIIQRSSIQSIFMDQAQVGVIALSAIVGALWIRRRRRDSRMASDFS